MANSYDVYTGTNFLGLIQVRISNGPSQTNRVINDIRQTGESDAEMNILRNDEHFQARNAAGGSAQSWKYVGNIYNGQGEQVGFYAVGGFANSTYGVFLPAGTGSQGLTLSFNVATGAGLNRTDGWLINESRANCFVQGTGIATPAGERAVEDLAIGDLVLTADGRAVPVRWIGRQAVFPRAASFRSGEGRLPVRIAAGALGAGLPARDLDLSADHAVHVQGWLVNAGALVNGGSIRFLTAADLPATFTYYHIETEDHDLILAHGLPAETFAGHEGRRAFDNHAEYLALFGAEREIAEQPVARISAARQLPQALRALVGLPGHEAAITADHDRVAALLDAA